MDDENYIDRYKCRGCGAIVSPSDLDETMRKTGESVVRVDFGCGEDAQKLCLYTGGLSGGSFYLLHRCDPAHVCVCDFIGWEVQKDG